MKLDSSSLVILGTVHLILFVLTVSIHSPMCRTKILIWVVVMGSIGPQVFWKSQSHFPLYVTFQYLIHGHYFDSFSPWTFPLPFTLYALVLVSLLVCVSVTVSHGFLFKSRNWHIDHFIAFFQKLYCRRYSDPFAVVLPFLLLLPHLSGEMMYNWESLWEWFAVGSRRFCSTKRRLVERCAAL